MKRFPMWQLLGAVPLVLAACAGPGPGPGYSGHPQHRHSATAAVSDGFFVEPPRGPHWQRGGGPAQIQFFKALRPGETPGPDGRPLPVPRTVVVSLELGPPGHILSVDDVFAAAENAINRQNVPNRYLVVARKYDAHRVGDTDCTRYDATIHETNNPRFPGIALKLAASGFFCRHPYAPNRMFHAHVSERGLFDGIERPEETHPADIAAMLGSLTFIPPR